MWDLPPSLLYEVYPDVLPDVLNTLYSLPEAMPWPALREAVHLACRAAFDLDHIQAPVQVAWLRRADADLRRVLTVLERLGALECQRGMASELFLTDLEDPDTVGPGSNRAGPGTGLGAGLSALPVPASRMLFPLSADLPPGLVPLPVGGDEAAAPADLVADRERVRALRAELTAGPVELIRLTPLGTWAVRERLLAEGRDAPLIGELTGAGAAELLGVLAEHYPPEAARVETEAWVQAHGGWLTALDVLLEAVRRTPFRVRAQDMLAVLAAVLPEDEAGGLLVSLRTDTDLAPTALSALVDQGLVEEEDLTDAEQLLLLTEAMLSTLEISGPHDTLDMLHSLGPGEAHATVQAALACGHPDYTGLGELHTLAEHLTQPHPDHPGPSGTKPAAPGQGTSKKRRDHRRRR